MSKRVLFIGDIVGKPGRQIVEQKLKTLIKQEAIDIVVANGENAAGGAGITKSIALEIKKHGVDAITLGDHVWDQKGFEIDIDQLDFVCRPANLPPECPGRRFLIIEKGDYKLGICTLMGRNFMKIPADNAFSCIDEILPELKETCDAVMVEVHAEATSEKVAMGFYLDGQVSLVVGTHTHIPTADAKVLPNGTAYLSDAGMTGPYQSVLGREVMPVIDRFKDGMPRKFPVAEGDIQLWGCLVTINEFGLAQSIRQIQLGENILHM